MTSALFENTSQLRGWQTPLDLFLEIFICAQQLYQTGLFLLLLFFLFLLYVHKCQIQTHKFKQLLYFIFLSLDNYNLYAGLLFLHIGAGGDADDVETSSPYISIHVLCFSGDTAEPHNARQPVGRSALLRNVYYSRGEKGKFCCLSGAMIHKSIAEFSSCNNKTHLNI